MSEDEDKIARANARADRIGNIGRHFLGPVKPEYYDAYMTVRPLLARLTTLSTRGAYRSFKMIGQLQRICRNPYLPQCIVAADQRRLEPVDSEWRTKLLRNCAILCSAVYPLPSVLNHGVSKVRNTKHWFVMKYRIEQLFKVGKVLLALDQGDVCMPAHAICVDEKANTFYVVIRGSSSPEDFVTNLMCDSVDELGPHRGMSIAAEYIDGKVRPLVREFLETNSTKKPSPTIVLTGHSLGAGVAALVCTRWKRDESMADVSSKTQCIAIACPAVFHEKDSYADNSQIKTIIFGTDIVPRLSYSSFSDLLVQMTALANHERKTTTGVPHAEDALSEYGSSTRATSAEDFASPVTRTKRSEDIYTEEDYDWKLLPEIIKTPESDEPPLLTSGIKFAGLTDSEAREHVCDLTVALKQKKNAITFGGASFNQINSLIRKNLKILEKEKALILIENTPASRFSCRWWFVKTVYKLVKFWHRIFYRSRERMEAESREQELNLLYQCYNEISDIRLKNENGFTPPGQIYLCVPRIHFLEQHVPIPQTRKTVHGQCYLFHMDRHEFIHNALDPSWSKASLNHHAMECYLQALAPETLKRFPIGIVVSETLNEEPEVTLG